MEVFLLLLEQIDDTVAMLRSAWPVTLGLALACSLLLATGFTLLQFPRLALPAVAVVLGATLFERLRRRAQDASLTDR